MMKEIPTFVPVVAVALRDRQDRLLLQQRPEGKHHAGLWEFPGGKVERNESPRAALIREIREELGVELLPESLVPSGFADGMSGTGQSLVLFLYTCASWSGRPEGREGQSWSWYAAKEAEKLPMPPMDRDLLKIL